MLLNKPNGAGAAPEFRCDLIHSLTSPCFLSIMRTLTVIKLENNISGCAGLEFRRIRGFCLRSFQDFCIDFVKCKYPDFLVKLSY